MMGVTSRLARIVVPGIAHHVTQRCNRRHRVFFSEEDYAAYFDLVAAAARDRGVRCLAWCLMPNHMHLILVPADAVGLRAALADARRRYSRRINFTHGWTGYLWQGRFASYPMDDAHLIAAIRYVEQNPVVAGLVPEAQQWRWSSAGAHVHGVVYGLTDLAALAGLHANWSAMLRYGDEAGSADDVAERLIEAAMRTGRPLGDDRFVEHLEAASGRALKKRKPGPRPGSAAQRGNMPDAHGMLAFVEPQLDGASSTDSLRISANSR